MSVETKVAVTVAEMARMVGLSRARFYQLLGSAFPLPVYDVSTRRPYFVEEMQRVCLEVRRRNCGIDGKPILFYCRRVPISASAKRSPKITTTKTNVPNRGMNPMSEPVGTLPRKVRGYLKMLRKYHRVKVEHDFLLVELHDRYRQLTGREMGLVRLHADNLPIIG